jgi:hypothetical protein
MRRSVLATTAITLAAAIALHAAPAAAHDMASMGASEAKAKTGAMGQMGSHMDMGPHMVMTASRPSTPEDITRARELLATLRRSIGKYQDYRIALAGGYVPFLPTIPQEVYHFVNYGDSNQEYSGHFNPERPGSLLYVKRGAGEFRLVGAMYSAPPEATPDQLNEMIPLSVGTWHAHVNICLPEGITLTDLLRGEIGANRTLMPGMIPVSNNPRAEEINRRFGFMADGRFGFAGKIADAETCRTAGGDFIKQAFGWMIHLYPFSGDDLKVAYGMDVPELTASSAP